MLPWASTARWRKLLLRATSGPRLPSAERNQSVPAAVVMMRWAETGPTAITLKDTAITATFHGQLTIVLLILFCLLIARIPLTRGQVPFWRCSILRFVTYFPI